MILWKCIECDEINNYPEDTYCQTCGERISPAQKEYVQRFEFLMKRANSGDLYAALDLYNLYKEGKELARNNDEVLKWLKYAADRENAKAQYEMGKLYFFENDLVEQNDAEALRWFTKSMNNNYPFATHYVAQCYSAGFGVQEDERNGFELYLENAKQGIAESMERVALSYKYGIGTEINEKQSFYWLKRATEIEGHELSPKSAYRLACYYFDGKITAKNDNEAIKLFQIAYNDGNQMAGCLMGEIFYNFGNPQTIGAAKNIWSMVAKSDDTDAA